MSCKGRFIVNHHTNEIVGMSTDAFQSNIIKGELNELEAVEPNARECTDIDKFEPKLPEFAKHFLVFIATTWSTKSKYQFLAARYSLKSVDSDFLIPAVREIILTISLYRWIVNNVTGDDASKNRTTFKNLATIPAKKIFEGQHPDDFLHQLPLDFNIAFNHPNPYYQDVKIFIGGEMPHWVKKFCNAIDNRSRYVQFCGKPIKLSMMKDAWVASGDANLQKASLRKYKHTWSHFPPMNSYEKMCVFLALQITSQTTIDMLSEFCSKEGG